MRTPAATKGFARLALGALASVAAAAVALAAVLSPAAGALAEVRRLVVVHTNDLHGQLLPGPDYLTPGEPKPKMGGFAAIAAAIEAERACAAAEGAGFLLLDAGDFFHGSPEGDATKGAAIVELMNLMGYDAACVGNHELAYGARNLDALRKAARFPILAGHWREEDEPAASLKETGGLEVAVVARPALVAGARKGADLVVLLRHAGSKADLEAAAGLRGCALIVGGHDHVALDPAPLVGETLVVQAGEYGHRVGKVVLDYDTEKRKVVRREATLLNLFEDAPRSPTVAAAIEKVRLREFDEVVGHAAEPIRRSFHGPSPAGTLACEAVREAAGAQVAVVNQTAVRGGFARGPVTRRDVYACVPFQEPIVVINVPSDCWERLHSEEHPSHFAGAPPVPRKEEREVLVYRLATTEFFAERCVLLKDRPRKALEITPYQALLAYFAKRSPVRGGAP